MASIKVKYAPPKTISPTPTSPLTITTRTDTTFPIRLLQFLIKPFGSKLVAPKKEFPAGSPKLDPHRSAKKKCEIVERQVEGIWLYDLRSKTRSTPGKGKEARKQRLFYFAGGGWQMPPSPEHWKLCSELCVRLPNTTITMISYPLAPHSSFRDSFPQLEPLYAELVSSTPSTEDIIFAGDSAGGNIALGLVCHMLSTRPSLRPPEKLLVVSPAVDLRPQPQPEFRTALSLASNSDPLLGIPFTNSTARKWCHGFDPSDPRISPIFADVEVLKRRNVYVFGVTAGRDVLGPPAVAFAQKCVEVGVCGRWVHWEGVMHCFPLASCYGIREGKMGLRWMEDVLRI